MMLCALSSLCHAQSVKFEYDSSGNVIKRYPPMKNVDNLSVGNYSIKLSLSEDGKTLNVKVLDGYTQTLVECPVHVAIRNGVYGYICPFDETSYIGEVYADVSSIGTKDFWLIQIDAHPSDRAGFEKTIKFKKPW